MPTIPTTMRAAAIDKFGDPEVLKLQTPPVPIPGSKRGADRSRCKMTNRSEHFERYLPCWRWESLVQFFEIVVGKLDIERSAVLTNVFRPAGFGNCN